MSVCIAGMDFPMECFLFAPPAKRRHSKSATGPRLLRFCSDFVGLVEDSDIGARDTLLALIHALNGHLTEIKAPPGSLRRRCLRAQGQRGTACATLSLPSCSSSFSSLTPLVLAVFFLTAPAHALVVH
jgi:hypothetical protein